VRIHEAPLVNNKRFYSERNALYSTLPFARLVLNAGCGSGAFCRYYPHPNSFVVNLDSGVPDEGVGWPAWGAAHRGWAGWCELSREWPQVKNVSGDIRDLSRFPSRMFDMVVLGEVIEHIAPNDAHLLVEELARILDAGGTLQIDTPNAVHPVKDYVVDHEHEYGADELKALVADHGFELTDWRELADGYGFWGTWRK
jgi:SAM-dependent methyltransferase